MNTCLIWLSPPPLTHGDHGGDAEEAHDDAVDHEPILDVPTIDDEEQDAEQTQAEAQLRR